MGTFNAGAIEAKLTLDRSPFQKSLDAARAQAKRFEAKPISPKLKLDTGKEFQELRAMLENADRQKIDIGVNVDEGEEFRALKAMVENADRQKISIDVDLNAAQANSYLAMLNGLVEGADNKIKIGVDLDDGGALAQLAALSAVVSSVDGDEVDIQVDVDAAAALAQLAAVGAAAAAVDANDVDVNVNASGNALQHFSRMEAIVSAVLLLIPLVPPVAAVATAAVVGISAGAVAALGALTAVGIAAFPTVQGMMQLNEEISKQKLRLEGMVPGSKEYIKQQGKINQLQKELKTNFGAASDGLQVMQTAWQNFQKEVRPETNELIGQVFRTIAQILPMITPIVEATIPVLSEMFKQLGGFVTGPEGQRVVAFFRDFGSKSLGTILDIGGNLLQFLGRLFEAFAPFGTTILNAIEDVTQAWADWADGLGETEGFKDFIAYVNEEGPKVWDLIKNLVGAMINLGKALAPLGSLWLDMFNGALNFISTMDPGILGAIVVAIGGMVTGFLLLAAGTALWNAAMNANPIGIIIVAVAALVAGIVYLWNTNEGFRNAIIGAWNAIYAAVETVVRWFTDTAGPAIVDAWNAVWSFFESIGAWFANTFGPIFSNLWDAIVGGAQAVWAEIGPIFTGIGDIISLVFQIAWEVVKFFWDRFLFIASAIAAPFIGIWNALSSGATNIWNKMSANISRIWNAMGTIASSIWNNIKSVLSTIWNVLVAVATGYFNAVKAVVTTVWNAIAAVTSFVWNQIKFAIMLVINLIKGILQAALQAMRGDVSGAMNTIKSTFSNAWNSIKSNIGNIIGNILSTVARVWGNIKSTLSNIMNSIVSTIRGKWNEAYTAVTNIVNNIKGFFGGAAGWLLDAGRNLINGLIEGIRQKFADAINIARNLLGELRNLLPFSPAKKGPFSGKGWTLYSGQSIVEGLATGMANRADFLQRTARRVIEKATPPAMDLQFGAQIAGAGGGGVAALLAAGAQNRKVEVTVIANNPVAERSSETAVKEVSRLGALGVFD